MKFKCGFGVLIIALLVSGCASQQDNYQASDPLAGASPTSDEIDPGVVKVVDGNNHGLVRVLFATNRELLVKNRCLGAYSGKRGVYGRLNYGHCMVSIPVGHEVGEIELRRWYQLVEDPNKHVSILGGGTIDEAEFKEVVRRDLNNGDGASLIFVHGFNVSFEDAARRTAQLAYDLNFKGVPVFFSWPSNGKVLTYNGDEESIIWSEDAIYSFLVDYLSNPELKQAFLIAHSMGGRGALEALKRISATRPELRGKLKEVVLAAPDVGRELFTDTIAPIILNENYPVTVYGSKNDRALKLSYKLKTYDRLGGVPAVVDVWKGVDFIDASDVKTDFLNHSYGIGSDTVLSDIVSLFSGNRPPQRNRLTAVEANNGIYWRLTK
nr:alpha/beta hydrolase [Pseudomonas sp. P13]